MKGDGFANRRRALSLDNMHRSFLTYRNGRYLKLGLAAAVLSIAVYSISYIRAPMVPPGGGTILGLIYGLVATAAIVLLMAYNVRKRSYRSRFGMLQGWLSAHFYMGLLTLLDSRKFS